MQVEYDETERYFDIIFNGDLCANCYHCDTCIVLKSIQVNALIPNTEEPIRYCNFYLEGNLGEKLNWFTQLTYKIQMFFGG